MGFFGILGNVIISRLTLDTDDRDMRVDDTDHFLYAQLGECNQLIPNLTDSLISRKTLILRRLEPISGIEAFSGDVLMRTENGAS